MFFLLNIKLLESKTQNTFSLLFEMISLTYFLISLCLIIVSIIIYTSIEYGITFNLLYSVIYLILLILFTVMIKIKPRITIKFIILFVSIMIILIDNNIVNFFKNNDNIKIMMKDRTMVILQLIIFSHNSCIANIVIILINFLILIFFNLEKFQNFQENQLYYEICYFLIYIFFTFFFIMRLKIKNYYETILSQKQIDQKNYSNILKIFMNQISLHPILQINVQKLKNQPQEKKKILTAKEKIFKSKLSITNDFNFSKLLTDLKENEYKFEYEYANEKAKNLFNLAEMSDYTNLMESSIIFSEKLGTEIKTIGSSKERAGNLKKECIKVFNNYKHFPEEKKENFPLKVFDSEYKIKTQSENKHFLINCLPFEENKKFKLFLFFNDITDKIELDRIKALDIYKDSVLANVTHDLRNPLNVIMSCLECFSNENDSNINNLVEMAILNGKLMENLIQDLLDDNQIKMGKIKLNLKEFSISSLFEEISKFMNFIAKQQQISINYYLDENFPKLTYSDPMRLKQVLINLINNSLKFTKKSGSITLHGKIPKDSNFICLSVQDTGIGIPQDTINKLFKPYSTFEGNGLNKQGIGLGLTICQNIVSLIGPYNRIFCHSVVGKGTKFLFYIYNNKTQFDERSNGMQVPSLVSADVIDKNAISTFLSDYHLNTINSNNKFIRQETEEKKNDNIITDEDEDLEELPFTRPSIKKFSNSNRSRDRFSYYLNSPNNINNNKSLKLTLQNIVEQEYLETCNICSMQNGIEITKKISPKNCDKNSGLGLNISKTYDCLPKVNQFSPTHKQRNYSIPKRPSPPSRISIFSKETIQHIKTIKDIDKAHLESPEKINYKKVLLIDDDSFALSVLETLIKKYFAKLDIIKAHDGIEALEILENIEVDLILTDLNMPFMTGVQFTEKFKETRVLSHKINIPVILLTGQGDICNSECFDEIIHKPLTWNVLKSYFNKYLM